MSYQLNSLGSLLFVYLLRFMQHNQVVAMKQTLPSYLIITGTQNSYFESNKKKKAKAK